MTLLMVLLWGFSVAWAETVSLKSISIPVPREWMTPEDRAFQEEELWWFPHEERYQKLLSSEGASEFRADLQKVTFDRHSIPEHLKARAQSLYSETRFMTGKLVAVPRELRDRIPKALLQEVYSSIHPDSRPFSVQYSNVDDLRRSLEPYPLSYEAWQAIDREVYFIKSQAGETKAFLFLTPRLKELLPQDWLDGKVYVSDPWGRQGYDATVTVRGDENLSEIAKKYAGDRDPSEVERVLRSKLEGKVQASFPLSDLLQPYIQERINRFSDRDGPNCRNCAITVGGSGPADRYIGEKASWRKVMSEFRLVKPTEALQAGDVLAYANEKGQFVHAVNYIGRGIRTDDGKIRELVFTKNGLSRLSPYLLADREIIEGGYFRDGKFRMIAFRKPRGNELTGIQSIAAERKGGGAFDLFADDFEKTFKDAYYVDRILPKPKPPVSVKKNCLISRLNGLLRIK